MKTTIIILLLLTLQLPASAQQTRGKINLQQKDAMKDQLSKFLDADQTLLDFATGDINNDKKTDVILIGTPDSNTEQYRTVYLLINEGNSRYKVAGKNSLIIDCEICGGAGTGDAYRKTIISNGTFSFIQLYGANEKTERTIAFKYDTKRRFWILTKDNFLSYSSGKDQKLDNEIKTTLKEHNTLHNSQIIKFEDFGSKVHR